MCKDMTNKISIDEFNEFARLMGVIDDLAYESYMTIKKEYPQILPNDGKYCRYYDILIDPQKPETVEVGYTYNSEEYFFTFDTKEFLNDPVRCAKEYAQNILDRRNEEERIAKQKQLEKQTEEDRKLFNALKEKYNW